VNTDRAGATRGTDEILTIRPTSSRASPAERPACRERRFQVYGNGLIEVAFGEVIDAANDRQPGVVDENVVTPSAEPARSTIFATAAACDTSAAIATARPPNSLIFATTASASSARSDN